jgi:hypothetical protein
MLRFLSLALVASTFAATATSQGVFTDTTCSCRMFDAIPGSKCVRKVLDSPGQCNEDDCVGGMKCDMFGDKLCARIQCKSWTAAPGEQTTSGPFSCSTSVAECVKEESGPNLQLHPSPDPTCTYTDSECSCVAVQKEGLCVQMQEKDGLTCKCKLGECSIGYKCDCLSPTHLCKRTDNCTSYTSSEVLNTGFFACREAITECAHVERELFVA